MNWLLDFGVGLNRCLRLSIGEIEARRDMENLMNALKDENVSVRYRSAETW